jgi:hypothetical protein
VAALAAEQLLTVRPFGQNAMHFSPYFKSHHLYKQKRHNRKGCTYFVGADDGI